jgi:hypothetical protein
MHRCITLLERLKVTPESYAEAINFQHVITAQVNKMRMQLDTEEEEE